MSQVGDEFDVVAYEYESAPGHFSVRENRRQDLVDGHPTLTLKIAEQLRAQGLKVRLVTRAVLAAEREFDGQKRLADEAYDDLAHEAERLREMEEAVGVMTRVIGGTEVTGRALGLVAARFESAAERFVAAIERVDAARKAAFEASAAESAADAVVVPAAEVTKSFPKQPDLKIGDRVHQDYGRRGVSGTVERWTAGELWVRWDDEGSFSRIADLDVRLVVETEPLPKFEVGDRVRRKTAPVCAYSPEYELERVWTVDEVTPTHVRVHDEKESARLWVQMVRKVSS